MCLLLQLMSWRAAYFWWCGHGSFDVLNKFACAPDWISQSGCWLHHNCPCLKVFETLPTSTNDVENIRADVAAKCLCTAMSLAKTPNVVGITRPNIFFRSTALQTPEHPPVGNYFSEPVCLFYCFRFFGVLTSVRRVSTTNMFQTFGARCTSMNLLAA